MRVQLVWLACALLLVAAEPALAQRENGRPAADATLAERRDLGQRIAHQMFVLVDIRSILAESVKEMDGEFLEGGRPEWSALLAEAMSEELEHDLPAIERLLGGAMAERMTLGELRAGATLIAVYEGQWAGLMAKSGAIDDRAPTLTKEQDRAVAAVMRSADGRSFFKKMDDLDNLFDDVEDEFMAELLPGMMRRFGEKAEAAEAARKSRGD